MTGAASPAPGRRTNAAAAATIVVGLAGAAEGMRQVAYYDPPGVLTVCAGHTGADVVKGRVYTLAECLAMLNDDAGAAVAQVERCVPGLPVHQLAAWGDAVFNLGPTIVCDPARSTAARLLRAHEYEAACRQLPRWNGARVAGVLVPLPGLTKRRAAEMELCLTAEMPA